MLEIQRMSTEDGPGIRTTVFFKGCTMKCLWCHNPESISPKPQLQWVGSKCIGCRTCLETCPNQALTMTPDGLVINRELCRGCGACADECPTTALELMGRSWLVDDLVAEVDKDRSYFEKSGGGITASGGEAALQVDFVSAFLAGCRDRGLSTALDTCGQYPRTFLERLLPHTDLILFDIKEIDPERHRAYTGLDNRTILDNLLYLRDWMKSHPRPGQLWIRTPIIPGATARTENIRGIGRFIGAHLKNTVTRWELCSFNNLCRDKYLRLGLDWILKSCELMTEDEMERLTQVARESGPDPETIHWTGMTRLMERPTDLARPRLHLVKDACNL